LFLSAHRPSLVSIPTHRDAFQLRPDVRRFKRWTLDPHQLAKEERRRLDELIDGIRDWERDRNRVRVAEIVAMKRRNKEALDVEYESEPESEKEPNSDDEDDESDEDDDGDGDGGDE
jgi:hypothetical protein